MGVVRLALAALAHFAQAPATVTYVTHAAGDPGSLTTALPPIRQTAGVSTAIRGTGSERGTVVTAAAGTKMRQAAACARTTRGAPTPHGGLCANVCAAHSSDGDLDLSWTQHAVGSPNRRGTGKQWLRALNEPRVHHAAGKLHTSS